MADEPHYPDWDLPASKGDLIRMGLAITRVLSQLAQLEMVRTDEPRRNAVVRLAAKEIQALSEFIDDIGGAPSRSDVDPES